MNKLSLPVLLFALFIGCTALNKTYIHITDAKLQELSSKKQFCSNGSTISEGISLGLTQAGIKSSLFEYNSDTDSIFMRGVAIDDQTGESLPFGDILYIKLKRPTTRLDDYAFSIIDTFNISRNGNFELHIKRQDSTALCVRAFTFYSRVYFLDKLFSIKYR